jgi:hypothetical protein
VAEQWAFRAPLAPPTSTRKPRAAFARRGFQRDSFGGEGEIRTLDRLLHTAFRERPVQPLLHLSNFSIVTDWVSNFLLSEDRPIEYTAKYK